jgi:hypothetical protein
MSNWRKFRTLSGPDRAVFIAAFLLLPVMGLATRLGGLARGQAVLSRLSSSPRRSRTVDDPRNPRPRTVARLVGAAAAHHFFRPNCLQRSLVLWWLLRLERIESRLRIGVRRTPTGLEAHAWVEHGGSPLNAKDDIHLSFFPLVGEILPVWGRPS